MKTYDLWTLTLVLAVLAGSAPVASAEEVTPEVLPIAASSPDGRIRRSLERIAEASGSGSAMWEPVTGNHPRGLDPGPRQASRADVARAQVSPTPPSGPSSRNILLVSLGIVVVAIVTVLVSKH